MVLENIWIEFVKLLFPSKESKVQLGLQALVTVLMGDT